jgi:type IV pilus assembly protein PilQ
MKRYLNRILWFFLIIIVFLIYYSVYNSEAQETTETSEVLVEQESKSSEELINLDFEETDIRDVMRVLAQKGGVNIILGQDVAANVTIQLKGVTWEKALDIILKNYNLTYKKEGNLIRVMTLEQLRLEEEKVPLTTQIITLDFADVEDIKGSLESMLSSRGAIQINARTNSLIITDIPDRVKLIKEIAENLDLRTPQVMIEALMADVKLTDQDSFGIDWTFTPNKREKEYSFTQSLQLAGSTAGSIIFNKTLLEKIDITSLLEFWRENKRVNILANPRVMTLDNMTATIELTEQIPYSSTQQTEQGSYTSTQFKEAGIKLYVTPQITKKENYISMNIKVEQSFRSGWTDDNQPIIDSRSAETNLMVRDGETIVIGGLRKKEDTVTIDKVPILGDIPLLGALFRKSIKDVTDIDLVIFVTPTIVEEPRFTKKERERFERFSEKREYETEKSEILKPIISEQPSAIKEEPFSLRPPD